MSFLSCNQQCQNTEGNTNHAAKSVAWPHPSFNHHRTPDVAPFTPAYLFTMQTKLACGPMPNVMVALPNTGGALCSTLQSLSDAHYLTAMQ